MGEDESGRRRTPFSGGLIVKSCPSPARFKACAPSATRDGTVSKPARQSANRGCPIKERERADRPTPYLISAHGLLRIKFGLSQDWRRKIKGEIYRTAHAQEDRLRQVSYHIPLPNFKFLHCRKSPSGQRRERVNDFSLSFNTRALKISTRG